jgi:DNA-binding Xre family transcriptional regulator
MACQKKQPIKSNLKKILDEKNITRIKLSRATKIPVVRITRMALNRTKQLNTKECLDIANYLNVSILDVFTIDSNMDKHNRRKMAILNKMLYDQRTFEKLKKMFTTGEKNYLVEMMRSEVYNIPQKPRKFLISTIIEADEYSMLSVKHRIRSMALADKITDLNDLEAFICINCVLEYNLHNTDNIELLFDNGDGDTYEFY